MTQECNLFEKHLTLQQFDSNGDNSDLALPFIGTVAIHKRVA